MFVELMGVVISYNHAHLPTWSMVLYMVGLGLCDASDITVKGLEVVRRASRVYLEAYTSILTVGREELEKYYGREVVLADREMVEQGADEILAGADQCDVVFLVVGDPLGATTHSDLIIRAAEIGVPYQVIHNASIINAIGCTGLQLYHFGETVSIPFWTDSWRPDSFVDRIESNLERGLHTLCLLDIKVKEQSIENLMKGRKVFEPPRYMTAAQAAEQLISAVQNRKESEQVPLKLLSATTQCVGVARVGSSSQCIGCDQLCSINGWELGGPLHSLVVVGKLHPLEEKMLTLACNAQKRTCAENDQSTRY